MRLSSFTTDNGPTWGVVADDDSLVDAAQLAGMPARLDDHLESDGIDGRTTALTAAAVSGGGIDPSTVTWLPPIRRPGKILGVAINNRMGQKVAHRPFADPAFFLKPPSSLTGHRQPVVIRPTFGITHPEPELAVIIGLAGRDIAEADALDHVFGYTIINDVTSPGLKLADSIELIAPPGFGGAYTKLLDWRNVIDEDHKRSNYLTYHARSKGTDTFGPIGPWIVTADEVEDPNDLAIRSYDGDTAVFDDSTANLVFSVRRIIAHASASMTLEPGDIIHCGTAMRPAPDSPYRGLTDWDLQGVGGRPMRIDIDGLGSLVNPIAIEEA